MRFQSKNMLVSYRQGQIIVKLGSRSWSSLKTTAIKRSNHTTEKIEFQWKIAKFLTMSDSINFQNQQNKIEVTSFCLNSSFSDKKFGIKFCYSCTTYFGGMLTSIIWTASQYCNYCIYYILGSSIIALLSF